MAENDQASRQPAKQRKAQAQAPQHRRREMMSAHLSEDLMLEYDRRSIALRTGDTVEVMRGDFAGHQGEVLEIDYDDQHIEVDGAVNRSADGSQVARPIHPSNVRITELDLTDPRRRAKLERKGVTVDEPEPEPEPEEEAEADEEAEGEEPAHVEPAEGAKGPDVAEPPEPEPEPEPEPDLEAEPDTDAEPDTEEPEAEDAAEGEPPAADEDEDTEADEADADEAEEPVDETEDDTTEEGSA